MSSTQLPIEQTQTHSFAWAIAAATATSGSVVLPLALQFKPDSVIVRQIVFTTADPASISLFKLHCRQLVSDQPLALFTDLTMNTQLNTFFWIPNLVLGQSLKFDITDAIINATNTNPATLPTGNLAFILEFIKYGKNENIKVSSK